MSTLIYHTNTAIQSYHKAACANPESFVRGGQLSDNVFFSIIISIITIILVDEGREDPNTT